MVTILPELGTTFSQYNILPNRKGRDYRAQDVDLSTKLTDRLQIGIPLLSAAMTSVTGFELTLALGHEGGMGVLPVRLPVEEQADIARRIKAQEMRFVDDPITVRETATVEEALRLIDRYGHSKIPVVNRNNHFLGMFVQEHYLENVRTGPTDNVQNAMLHYGDDGIDTTDNPSITVADAKQLLDRNGRSYLVVLDEEHRLVKLAFKKDIEQIKVGAAINFYDGWEKRVRANIDAKVDLLVVDTSDADHDAIGDAEGGIRKYKAMGITVPLCVGNVVTYEAALFLMRAGADIVKEGMSSGSICSTRREKATGRAPMTSLRETARARDDFFRETGMYRPILADGGMPDAASMAIALTCADALMAGGYFNRFFEAAGEKFDAQGKVTTDETRMVKVATWGEGSARAYNLLRYGQTKKTFFAEGVEDFVPYMGRLKPNLKQTLARIQSAINTAGCKSLPEFRERAILECDSPAAQQIVGQTHHLLGSGQ